MIEKYDVHSREGKKEGRPGFWLAVLALGWLTGCGYSLNNRLKDGFQNPQGIFVPVFTNTTPEIGAERIFTDAFIREMQSRGTKIIAHRAAGAYEMRGSVSRITYGPTNLTPTTNTVAPYGTENGLRNYRRLPTEVMVDAEITLQLVDPKDNRVLWSGSFSNYRRVPALLSRTFDYQAPSSLPLIQQSLIEAQYSGIARDIMRDAYDAMVELL